MWKEKLFALLTMNKAENVNYKNMCALCFDILFAKDGVLQERKKLKIENEQLKERIEVLEQQRQSLYNLKDYYREEMYTERYINYRNTK